MNSEAVNLKRIYKKIILVIDQFAMPSLHGTCFHPLQRVYSETLLNPLRTWYLFDEKNWQFPLRKIKVSAVFKAFPNEFVLDVDPSQLRRQDGEVIDLGSNSRAQKVAVGTTFAFLITILRLQDLTKLTEENKKKIGTVIEALSAIDFTESSSKAGTDFGARAKKDGVAARTVEEPPQSFKDFLPVCHSSPKALSSKASRSIAVLEENNDLCPKYKKRKIRERAREIFQEVSDLCEQHQENLPNVISHCCLNDSSSKPSQARETVQQIVKNVAEVKGSRKAFDLLVDEGSWEKRLEEMRVPDWQLLLFKLQGRVSDEGWQNFTNLTRLGRTGVSI